VLLDSRGEPIKDTKTAAELQSSKEWTMEFKDLKDIKEAEQGKSPAKDPWGRQDESTKAVSRKATAVGEQMGEGAKDVAQTVGAVGTHAAEGAKDIAKDASQGAKGVAQAAQAAAGHALESGKDIAKDAGQGAKGVAQAAQAAAGHALESGKDIAKDAGQGAKGVAQAAQAAAGHALESGKHVVEDIKEGTKDLARTAAAAAGEAKELVQEAAEEAGGIVRTAKQRAVQSMSSAIHQVGPSIRRANRATGAFVATNAVPISLLGFGAGWLMMSSRRRSSSMRGEGATMRGEGAMARAADVPTSISIEAESLTTGEGMTAEIAEIKEEVVDIARGATGRMHDVAEGVRKSVRHASSEARHRAADIKERAVHQVEHASHVVSERATAIKKETGIKLDHAKEATKHLAETNPLLLLALSLGAGMSTAAIFPSSKPEKRLMGQARDRLVAEASDTASRVGRVARKTARDIKENISP